MWVDTWAIPNILTPECKGMKKIQKTLIVIGALCILYGIGVVAIIGVTHWFDLFGIIAGIGIAGIGFTMPFFKSLPRLLRYLFILILITVLSGFIFTEMPLCAFRRKCG